MDKEMSLGASMERERKWLDEQLVRRGAEPARDDEWEACIYELQLRADAGVFAQAIIDSRPEARTERRALSRREARVPDATPLYDAVAWDAYRARLFESFRTTARLARGVLGVRVPLEPEQMTPLLREARQRQQATGAELPLAVPVLDGGQYTAEEWTVYRGAGESAQPLAHLASFAARVASRTGVDLAGAVLYLLCGVVVWWSPLRVETSHWPRFEITVRCEWPFIEPRAVADAYTSMRGQLFFSPTPEGVSREDALKVGRAIWSSELVQFAAQRRALGIPWTRILEEWTATYPGGPTYKSAASMRRSYEAHNAITPMKTIASAPWRVDAKEDL